MEHSLEALSRLIKDRVQRYEQEMTSAMAEGSQEAMEKVNDDFEKDVGKEVERFGEMAGEPLKSALRLLFAEEGEG